MRNPLMGVARWIASPWKNTGVTAFRAFEAVLARPGASTWALVGAVASALAAWWVYVPIHELLHAFACLAFGGEVEELQIGSAYGGALLARVLPFVKAGVDYAGRLSGFDTHGSDLVYLATDIAPYLLTVLAAFPLLRAARRRRSALVFGPGAVLAAAPIMGLTGDYYEMGSILVSAALRLPLGSAHANELLALRHDDLFAFLPEFATRFPHDRWLWGVAVAASAIVGWVLAGLTLAAARRVAGRFGGTEEPTVVARGMRF